MADLGHGLGIAFVPAWRSGCEIGPGDDVTII